MSLRVSNHSIQCLKGYNIKVYRKMLCLLLFYNRYAFGEGTQIIIDWIILTCLSKVVAVCFLLWDAIKLEMVKNVEKSSKDNFRTFIYHPLEIEMKIKAVYGDVSYSYEKIVKWCIHFW